MQNRVGKRPGGGSVNQGPPEHAAAHGFRRNHQTPDPDDTTPVDDTGTVDDPGSVDTPQPPHDGGDVDSTTITSMLVGFQFNVVVTGRFVDTSV